MSVQVAAKPFYHVVVKFCIVSHNLCQRFYCKCTLVWINVHLLSLFWCILFDFNGKSSRKGDKSKKTLTMMHITLKKITMAIRCQDLSLLY